jgi:hypothetical protein
MKRCYHKSSPQTSRNYATLNDILVEMARYRLLHPVTISKHLRALKIRPLGEVRQCPQIYPADSACRILKRLGILSGNARS